MSIKPPKQGGRNIWGRGDWSLPHQILADKIKNITIKGGRLCAPHNLFPSKIFLHSGAFAKVEQKPIWGEIKIHAVMLSNKKLSILPTFDLTSRISSSFCLPRFSRSLSLRSSFSFCSVVLWSWTSIRIFSLESAPHDRQAPFASFRRRSCTRPRNSVRAEFKAPFLSESEWMTSSDELDVSTESLLLRRGLWRSWLHKVLICW